MCNVVVQAALFRMRGALFFLYGNSARSCGGSNIHKEHELVYE
jgi:hypothetical protein